MTDVWRTTGFSMVIYLGLQAIPHEYYEFDIDEPTDLKVDSYHITLLAPSITVNVVLALRDDEGVCHDSRVDQWWSWLRH